MKGFKILLGVVVVLVVMAGISSAAQIGNTANKPCPIVTRSAVVAVETSSATTVVTIAANSSRIAGYIENRNTTYSLGISFSTNTASGIASDCAVIPPRSANAADGSNKWNFVQDGVVYQGAVYVVSLDSTTLAVGGTGTELAIVEIK